jgi:aspartate/tyrosine/aromatic aminotransferase
LKGARGVLFGWDHKMVTSDCVVSAQSLSGGGALRLLCEFLQDHRKAPLYYSNPTWGNHPALFEKCGIEARKYRYYNETSRGLDFEGMIEDLRNADEGSCILLHTCAHNPTGVDPTFEQWVEIAKICKERKLYPFFDTAY